ncbi:sensory transduction histidine kinase [Fulvimarina pelagi HTCC2506]|uniref:histidine kinase n=1 Tax=Fulvimarina pelagi HTCC2506 TaxID=314231 RepID=Q0G3Z5_9HYPH|nr:HWE histidine kinase domain-containing protein [Fulvimarina pelagi]EAU41686.1 sensory transduction histidine kinase [Fulvimarina pelagi HTCC2506]
MSSAGRPPRHGWDLTLARSILLASLVGIVIVMGLGVAVWRSQWDQSVDRATSEARRTAFFLSQHAEQLFIVSDLALQKAVQIADGGDWGRVGNSRTAHEALVSIREDISYIEDLWLNDADGRLRLTSFRFPTPPSSAADRDAFKAQIEGDGGLYVGGPITGRVTSRGTFLVSRRIVNEDGGFAGTAMATVDLGYFNDFWTQLTLSDGMRVTVFRAEDMSVLTSWPESVPSPPDTGGFTEQITEAAKTGEMEFVENDDIRFGSYHRIGDRAVYVRVTQSSDALAEEFWQRFRPLMLFAGFGLLPLLALMAVAWRMAVSAEGTRLQLDREVRQRTADLRAETRLLDTLNRSGLSLSAKLDQDGIVQMVVDSATVLSGARYGAFFYLKHQPNGEHLRLHVLSGAKKEDFAQFADPRETAVFAPTFADNRVVRSDDITKDPRYARGVGGTESRTAASADYTGGMPHGHLPVRSYLAVPVVNWEGKAHGAVLLGHPEPGRFSMRHEELIRGLAAQGAIALDNAGLFEDAQREIIARRAAEDEQRILIDELNHRVKNMLATIKAVLKLSSRSASDVSSFTETFVNRLSSLAATHTILTEGMRQSADLKQIIENEVAPYAVTSQSGATGARIGLDGPSVELPATIAVPLGMGLHELVTNAVKYGALSVPAGRLTIRWWIAESDERPILELRWLERNGPPVSLPERKGFGSQLLQRVLVDQIGAECSFDFDPAGLSASITVELPHRPASSA